MHRRCRMLDPPDALTKLREKSFLRNHVPFLFSLPFIVKADFHTHPARGSQSVRRRAASPISSVEPANEKRTHPPPSIGSKSRPGVTATPVSIRRRRQNSSLSRVTLEISA